MSMFERIPPMLLRHWSVRTCHLSLEQKGLLIDALDCVWVTPTENVNLDAIRMRGRVDPRRFKRLWTEDVQRAFDELRRERRPIDEIDRARVLAKTGGRCCRCGCELTDEPDQPNSFHVDHRRPVTRGGSSDIENLDPMCRDCNLKKGARHAGT